MRHIANILIFLSALTGMSLRAKQSEQPTLFVEMEVADKNLYEHETFTATAVLYSTSPDIAYANRLSAPQLENGEFDIIRIVPADRRMSKKEFKGKEYYCVPLESFILSVGKKGSYKVLPPTYDIGVAVPAVVNDPFWGSYRTTRTTSCQPSSLPFSIKVKSIPDAPSGSTFSGSVGEFGIRTVIPKGDIIVGEEATAIVVVSGPGIIADSVLPEYRGAFNTGLKLKSVSESRSSKIVNGKLVSELSLECTFIPERRDDVRIGVISFDFFNPSTGKYETVRTSPAEVTVKSAVSKREQMSV